MSEQTSSTETTKPASLIIFLGLRTPRFHEVTDTQAVFATLTGEQFLNYKRGEVVEPEASSLLHYTSDFPKQLSLCEPGAVYEVTLDGNTIRYKKHQSPLVAPQYTHPIVREWSATHRATKAAMEAAKRLAKESKVSAWKDGLDPVRTAYHKLNGPQRAQLIADVISYITR